MTCVAPAGSTAAATTGSLFTKTSSFSGRGILVCTEASTSHSLPSMVTLTLPWLMMARSPIQPAIRCALNPSESANSKSALLVAQHVPPAPWVSQISKNSSACIPGRGRSLPARKAIILHTLSNGTFAHQAPYNALSPEKFGEGALEKPSRSVTRSRSSLPRMIELSCERTLSCLSQKALYHLPVGCQGSFFPLGKTQLKRRLIAF